MADIEGLKAVLKTIKETQLMPEGFRWDQSQWLKILLPEDIEDSNRLDISGRPVAKPWCGTSMCFAGWAVYNAGYTQSVKVDGEPVLMNAEHRYVSEGEVQYMAARILDLNSDDAQALFEGDNDIEALEDHIDRIERFGGVWCDEACDHPGGDHYFRD